MAWKRLANKYQIETWMNDQCNTMTYSWFCGNTFSLFVWVLNDLSTNSSLGIEMILKIQVCVTCWYGHDNIYRSSLLGCLYSIFSNMCMIGIPHFDNKQNKKKQMYYIDTSKVNKYFHKKAINFPEVKVLIHTSSYW